MHAHNLRVHCGLAAGPDADLIQNHVRGSLPHPMLSRFQPLNEPSGESTPLLKEFELTENIDTDGQHKNAVLFSSAKILQASKSSEISSPIPTPNAISAGTKADNILY